MDASLLKKGQTDTQALPVANLKYVDLWNFSFDYAGFPKDFAE